LGTHTRFACDLGGAAAAFSLLRATAPSAISYNEGWNTYWRQATAASQRLYDTPPGLTIENYPPLSFHLIGLLGRMTGDTNLAGRAVALLSLGLVCGLALFTSNQGRHGVLLLARFQSA
jgi:hypothetical protein